MRLNFKIKKQSCWMLFSILALLVISFSSYATGTIEELESETQELEVELGDINEEIVVVYEELEEIKQMIELTEAQMGKTLDELAASKIQEAEQYENMKTRIQYMYEGGSTSLLEILFSAESLVDFVNKTEFVNNVMEYDRDMLEELTAIRQEIEYEEANLQDEEVALVDLQAEAELKLAELQAMADEIEVDIEDLEVQIAEMEAEAERLAQEEAEAQAQAEAEAEQNNTSGSSNNSSTDTSGNTSDSTSDSGNDYSAEASEVELLAALLDCEAIETYEARMAVATVVMNRVASSSFPNTVYGVIYESGQFSPTWTGKLDRRLEIGVSSLSYQVAEDALNGTRLDSVSNCYYFLYAGGTNRTGIEIGGNVFFTSW
ncbi:MAG: cell wall hydrolase [Eubacteriales bacterium]